MLRSDQALSSIILIQLIILLFVGLFCSPFYLPLLTRQPNGSFVSYGVCQDVIIMLLLLCFSVRVLVVYMESSYATFNAYLLRA